MLVEGRQAHVHHAGQPLDIQGAVEVGAHPGNRLRDLLQPGILLADLGDPAANGAQQQANEDLLHRQRGQHGRHPGLPQHLHQPNAGVDDPGVGLGDTDGMAALGLGQTLRKYLQHQFGDLLRIKVELEADERCRRTGLGDLARPPARSTE